MKDVANNEHQITIKRSTFYICTKSLDFTPHLIKYETKLRAHKILKA